MSQARVDATIRGVVQGVGYRWFVSRTAARLDLTGWVANRPDGSVQVVAEGSEHALDSLLEALRRGPSGADVSAVDVQRSSATGAYSGFQIRAASHPGD
jgi:acylphosphatase